MSDETARNTDTPSESTYTVSPQVRELLGHTKRRWRRMARQQRHWFKRRVRAWNRDPIRGDLVAHRRQFGVSHKSVQDGQRPEEREG